MINRLHPSNDEKDQTDLFLHFAHQQLLFSLFILLQHFLTLKRERSIWVSCLQAFFSSGIVSSAIFSSSKIYILQFRQHFCQTFSLCEAGFKVSQSHPSLEASWLRHHVRLQIHFTIQTSTFCNVDKYILQFKQIKFKVSQPFFRSLVCEASCPQIHFAI